MKITKSAETEHEFKQVDEMFADAFQDIHHSSVSWSWWRAFHDGCMTLQYDGEIIGSTMCFPITKASMDAFLEGKIGENGFQIESEQRSFWYISDVVIKPEHRTADNIIRLTHASIDGWLHFVKGQTYPLYVLATASSSKGEKLGKGLHLEKFSDSGADGLPIYGRKINNAWQKYYIWAAIKVILVLYPPFRTVKKYLKRKHNPEL